MNPSIREDNFTVMLSPFLDFAPIESGNDRHWVGNLHITCPSQHHPWDCFVASAPRNDSFSESFVAAPITVNHALIIVIAARKPFVMLNLFQHLSFQFINHEIPKQVRNDSSKGSPEGIPSSGCLGMSHS